MKVTGDHKSSFVEVERVKSRTEVDSKRVKNSRCLVAQLVACPALGFIWGLELSHVIEPCAGLHTQHRICLGFSLPHSALPPYALSFSNKSILKKQINK